MSEENKKYVLFFSTNCDYCNELLSEIQKSNLEDIFNFFNVDIRRTQLPKFVNEVPCVFLPEFNHVLSGDEVFGLLNHMKKELGLIPPEPKTNQMQPPQQPHPSQMQTMTPQNQKQNLGMQSHPSELRQKGNQSNELPPRMIPQSTGVNGNKNINAPSKKDDDELEGYNICEMGLCSDSYSYLDDDKVIQHNFELISNESNSVPQNIPQENSDPRKGMLKEQKISDHKYQEFIRNRNSDTPKAVDRL